MKSISLISCCLFVLLALGSFTLPTRHTDSAFQLRMPLYGKLNDCSEYGLMNFEKKMKFHFTQTKPGSKKLTYKIKRVDIVVSGKSFDITGAKIPSTYIREWKTFYEANPKDALILYVTFHLEDAQGKIRMYSTEFSLGDYERMERE